MVAVTHSHAEHSQNGGTFRDVCLRPSDIQIRTIGFDDLREALRLGWEDFGRKPVSAVPLIILFYVGFAILFTLFAFGQELRYLAFPIVAGFNLIGPIIAIGFFAMSRLRERGQSLSWAAAFDFIHTSSFAPILALSLLMMLLYLAWLYMAELIFFTLFDNASFESMSAFVSVVFSTREGGALMVYGNFVGFLFAFAAMALSVVSFPLALDKPVTSITAISVSIRAFTSNFLVLATWGLMVVAILAAGAALFLIGMAAALPVLGHATWHLYRKLIV